MFLHLTVRFLDARYHGRRDLDEPEWPPSPFRVFQAILAGAKAHWTGERGDALRWLQSLPPPQIRAPKATISRGITTYVPNNNLYEPGATPSRTPKLIRPLIFPTHESFVDYVWEFDGAVPNAKRLAETVADCARRISYVGWGIDLAIGYARLVERSPAEASLAVFRPGKLTANGMATRVPCAGSLESLEKMHEHSSDRIRHNPRTGDLEVYDRSSTAQFDVVSYHSTSLKRPSIAFVFADEDGDSSRLSFQPRRIKSLVGMIRGLLGSAKVRRHFGNEIVDGMFLGHPRGSDAPRLSILPLLSVGHEHADGRIRRVILAEPVNSPGAICGTLATILNGEELLANEHDPVHPSQPVARLVLAPNDDPYIQRWYAGAARQWASVSPVLLPGFDDRADYRRSKVRRISATRKLDRAYNLMRKALEHADISQACQIELDQISWWPNLPHARDFIPRNKLGAAPRYHVKLNFEEPFHGPLSLGRQRHTGLGVFAALDPIR